MKIIQRLYAKYSPVQAFYYWRSKQSAEHLYHSLDHDELKSLLKYKDDTGHAQYRKYFNASYWLQKNVQRAAYLGLHRKKPISILMNRKK